ncbi:MAG: DUF1997 domain-containing protein, partial [Cyanobacteria bacterium P01_H01_bin.15]
PLCRLPYALNFISQPPFSVPLDKLAAYNQLDSNQEAIETADLDSLSQAMHFQTAFAGVMEMHSCPETVANYLNAHEQWFCRCAQPMQAEPFGDRGYLLRIGRFKQFGYEVEPCMCVVLKPPVDRTYVMHTVPGEKALQQGYEVDYQASLSLEEVVTSAAKQTANFPDLITQVTWQLQLHVWVQFPRFIYRLPSSLLQATGDRLLSQIVRQVSPRLTQKVQKDFHNQQGLPLPPKSSRQLWKLATA